MATELVANNANVKIRSIWAPLGLSLITLGVYGVVHYYKINRELRDFGTNPSGANYIEVNPWLSVLATTLGALLFVPPFVSWHKTAKRVQKAQEIAGINEQLSLGLFWALMIFTNGIGPAMYVQAELNKVWRTYLNGPGGNVSSPDFGSLAPKEELAGTGTYGGGYGG